MPNVDIENKLSYPQNQALVIPPAAAANVTPPHRAWALYYASLGWHVLPVFEIGPDGCCTCNPGGECSQGSPGKHPRTTYGVSEATADPRQIEAWWAQWPTANVGLATGARSGIVVLDVDASDGKPGLTSLD